MKTQFTSNQYNVSTDNLSNHFNHFITNVEDLNLWDISISPSGRGHYAIKAIFKVNGEELVVNTSTSNMQLIDAWKSGMSDYYEDGEDGFDSWNEAVESMLNTINAEDSICEYLFWKE